MNPVTNNLFRVFCVGLLTLGGLTSAPVAWAVDPCCGITSINANGRVTARELAGKRVFQFQVTDQAILQGLRVGQKVHADFTAMKVSVQPDGLDPCCAIVQAAGGTPGAAKIPAVKLPTVMGVDPCCSITSIAQSGQVTARQTSSKRVFQFQVNDKALLATLRPGQRIHADFATMKVSVQPDGGAPCCQIVQAAAPKVTPPSVTADKRGGISGQGEGDPIPTESLKPDVMAGDPCCSVVANPALKGRMGRLVVAYPQGAKPSQARLYVYGADDKEIARSDGNYSTEFLPGTYAVMISGVRVKGVTIRSGHDTQVKVGVLRLGVGGKTRVSVYDTARKLELTRSDGKQDIGFPIGTVQVNLAGQFSAATIQEGKITDF